MEETGLRNCLTQIKGQSKVILPGELQHHRSTGPRGGPPQAWRDAEAGMLWDKSREHPLACSLGSSDQTRTLHFVATFSHHRAIAKVAEGTA